jgi:uncharacterized OB-fold protein
MTNGLIPLDRDAWSAPFFDGATAGQLLLLRCHVCRSWSAPQVRRCAVCSSPDVEWTESAGRGEIVTWVAPHERQGSGTSASYVVAIVQLDEGPWIYANGAADVELWQGRPVTIEFVPVDDGESLPVLRIES